jgi:hypothetical protein
MPQRCVEHAALLDWSVIFHFLKQDRGDIDDSLSLRLAERYNYKQEDMVILLDTPGANARQVPTRANIISAMQWLVSNAQPNDSLFCT